MSNGINLNALVSSASGLGQTLASGGVASGALSPTAGGIIGGLISGAATIGGALLSNGAPATGPTTTGNGAALGRVYGPAAMNLSSVRGINTRGQLVRDVDGNFVVVPMRRRRRRGISARDMSTTTRVVRRLGSLQARLRAITKKGKFCV